MAKKVKAKRRLSVTALATTATVSMASYHVYHEYDERKPREYIVMRVNGSKTAEESGKTYGEVKRKVEGLNAVVVKSSKHGVHSLGVDPGIIVEEVTHDFKAMQWPPPGGGFPGYPPPGGHQPGYPPPRPPPGYQPQPPAPQLPPQCPPCQCQCKCCGGGETPPPPPPTPTPEPPPDHGSETEDYGVKMVGTVEKFGVTDARNIKVCITDTGVDSSHPDLHITAGVNFSSSNRNDFMDRVGHGTHCAGAIAAVHNTIGVVGSSQAQILMAKVLGDDGSGSNESIAQGIKWCIDQGADVISMSLGGPQPSRILESVLTEASQKGIWIFAAAGNDGRQQINYPSGFRIPNLFSVSAVDQQGRLAKFSSYGKVEMTCPGVETLSTVPGGGYERMSGTSMATPICAGVGAMYRSVNKQIQFKEMGDPTRFGHGLPTADGL